MVLLVFALSTAFICVYIQAAQSFWNKQKSSPRKGWYLIAVGVAFSIVQLLALSFWFDKNALVGSIFMWFCANGIFSVLALRIVHGLVKYLKDINNE
jgi:pheromone shutdown protein TraB